MAQTLTPFELKIAAILHEHVLRSVTIGPDMGAAIAEIKAAVLLEIPKEKNQAKYSPTPIIEEMIAEANYNQAIKEITEKIK